MIDPPKGWWGQARPITWLYQSMRSAVEEDVNAVLPAAARVVEMPTAPGEPPCVYVRGQRVLQWRVWDRSREPIFAAASLRLALKYMADAAATKAPGEKLSLTCEVVIETRTKEEPAK